MSPPHRVGAAVPAYEPNLDRLLPYLHELREHVADEVVVALDDPAPGIVEALEDRCRLDVSETRRGKGAAVTDAFETLAPDVDALVLADADASTPVSSLVPLVSALDDGPQTLAVGSRRHPGAEVRSHQSVVRRSLGTGFVALSRSLLDVKLSDYQCGAKAITTAAWERVREHLHEPGFAWDVELIAVAHALGVRVVEVPVVWEDQPGKTVSPIRDAASMARGLLSARERAAAVRGSTSPLARFVCRNEPLLDYE